VQFRSPTYGPYAATKAVQDMYAGVLAKELGARRIAVNAVAPGLVSTSLFTDGKTAQQIQGFIDRTPMGRLGEPSNIADTIAALCGGDGAWVSGQTIFSNGAVV
jgi:3-oxoacyl-[acyl-carrier protein] reductase